MAPPRAPDVKAHLDLALAYLEMGLEDDSIAELEIVLRQEPENDAALNAIAAAYRSKAEKAAAREAYERRH